MTGLREGWRKLTGVSGGLAAKLYAVGWEQALERVAEHAKTFAGVPGAARNITPAGCNHQKKTCSSAAYDAIKSAHTVALRVEAEIQPTNAIAEEHDRTPGKTVLNDPKPRFAQGTHASVTVQIAGLAPTAA